MVALARMSVRVGRGGVSNGTIDSAGRGADDGGGGRRRGLRQEEDDVTDESTIAAPAPAAPTRPLTEGGSLGRYKRGLGPEEDGVLKDVHFAYDSYELDGERARRARRQRRVAEGEPPRPHRDRGSLRRARHGRVQPGARRASARRPSRTTSSRSGSPRTVSPPSATARSCRSVATRVRAVLRAQSARALRAAAVTRGGLRIFEERAALRRAVGSRLRAPRGWRDAASL